MSEFIKRRVSQIASERVTDDMRSTFDKEKADIMTELLAFSKKYPTTILIPSMGHTLELLMMGFLVTSQDKDLAIVGIELILDNFQEMLKQFKELKST